MNMDLFIKDKPKKKVVKKEVDYSKTSEEKAYKGLDIEQTRIYKAVKNKFFAEYLNRYGVKRIESKAGYQKAAAMLKRVIVQHDELKITDFTKLVTSFFDAWEDNNFWLIKKIKENERFPSFYMIAIPSIFMECIGSLKEDDPIKKYLLDQGLEEGN